MISLLGEEFDDSRSDFNKYKQKMELHAVVEFVRIFENTFDVIHRKKGKVNSNNSKDRC